jgi:hypothetical protein
VTRLRWKLGSVRLEIVLLLMQDCCTICVECNVGSEIVLGHPTELLVMCVMWNLVSIYLEIVLASVQDRCSVFVKRTIGSLIVLGAPDGTPR